MSQATDSLTSKPSPVAVGQRYGRLLVTEFAGLDRWGSHLWRARCDCGGETITRTGHLRSAHTKSCGCANGRAGRHRFYAGKHGLTGAPEHRVWQRMLERCRNPNRQGYANYGGRGIKVCERWLLFVNFYTDMGPRPSPDHSIDRIDNDGDYGPANCRWATRSEQQQNKRPPK